MARNPRTSPSLSGPTHGGQGPCTRGKPRVWRVLDRARSAGAGLVVAAVTAMLTLGGFAQPASAQLNLREVPEDARGLEVNEHLGELARLSTRMTTSEGQPVTLDAYFNQKAADGHAKPVILAMVYYECPIVCDLVREKLLLGLNGLGFTAGEDYNLVVVSFDPTEPYRLAADAKAYDLASYSRSITPEVRSGFAYHVADASEVRALGESIGFRFRLLDTGDYSHPVALTVLTPEGRVARYMYGFEYPSHTLRLALLEASDGTISESLGDRFIAFCYHYDPTAGTYSLQAFRVMQLGGIVTVVGLVGLVGTLIVVDRFRHGKTTSDDARGDAGANPSAGQRGQTRGTGQAPRVVRRFDERSGGGRGAEVRTG